MSVASLSSASLSSASSRSLSFSSGLSHCSDCHKLFSEATQKENELSLFCQALQEFRLHYQCAVCWLEYHIAEVPVEDFQSQPETQAATEEMNKTKRAVHSAALNTLAIFDPKRASKLSQILDTASQSIQSALLTIKSSQKVIAQLPKNKAIPGRDEALGLLECLFDTLKDGPLWVKQAQPFSGDEKNPDLIELTHNLAIATIGSFALLALVDQNSDT